MVSDASKKKAAQKKAAAAAKRGGKAAAASSKAAPTADKVANGIADIHISDRNCTGVLCSHPLSRDIRGYSMESPHSVNSPRRTLSLSKQRRATVSFLDPDDKNSGFGLSGEHGPKPAEVYGFVGSITTVAATVIFLVWAYVSESWLQSIGISYYPSRYWALALPTYLLVTIVLGAVFYIGLNFIATPPPESKYSIFDEFTRDPSSPDCSLDPDEKPIEPISDIGIDRINDIMFNGAT